MYVLRVADEGFGEYLKRAMDARGVNQAELARVTGVNGSLIGRWLKDEVAPGMENLRRVSKALRVPYLDLVVAAGHMEPEEARMKRRPEPPEVPVGAGVDPELLAELSDAQPDEIERVKAYVRGIKDGRR